MINNLTQNIVEEAYEAISKYLVRNKTDITSRHEGKSLALAFDTEDKSVQELDSDFDKTELIRRCSQLPSVGHAHIIQYTTLGDFYARHTEAEVQGI